MNTNLQNTILTATLAFLPATAARPSDAVGPAPPPPLLLEEAADAVSFARAEVARHVDEVQRQLTGHQGRVGEAGARALELAQAALGVAQASEGSAPTTVSTGFRLGGWKARGGGDALVIRSSAPDAKSQSTLEEDLAVMGRVLAKAATETLGEERRPRAMGIDVFIQSSRGGPRAFYLEDYGAVFLLEVPTPLLPPPEPAERAKGKPETDASWEEARRELYGEPSFLDDVIGKSLRFEMHGESLPDYDAKKVESLKGALLGALKNARNIRGLQPDETLTICVSGGAGGEGAGKRVVRVERNGDGDNVGAVTEDLAVTAAPGGRAPARGSLMTIRVKKADADAFASGELDLAGLQKKARIAIYPGGAGSAKGQFNWEGLRR